MRRVIRVLAITAGLAGASAGLVTAALGALIAVFTGADALVLGLIYSGLGIGAALAGKYYAERGRRLAAELD